MAQWTDEELQILKTEYLKSGASHELMDKLPGRSKSQIYFMASKLHLSRKGKSCTKKSQRVNEEKLQGCGAVCRIVAYRQATDIDVYFLPDGPLLKHKQYDAFLKGGIKSPKLKRKSTVDFAIGDTRLQRCGLKATIKDIKQPDTFIVCFEDGYIAKASSKLFSIGTVPHPKYPVQKNQAYGQIYPLTINNITYNSIADLAATYHKAHNVVCRLFAQGLNPEQVVEELSKIQPQKNNRQDVCKDHKGNIYKNVKEKCKAYNIPFSTYYKRKTAYGWSEEDALTLPKGSNRNTIQKRNERMGKVFLLNCGLHAKVESFIGNSCEQCVISFLEIPGETKNTEYSALVRGEVNYTKFDNKHQGTMYGFINVKYIMSDEHNPYFSCECKICHQKDILTPAQMRHHQVNNHRKYQNIPTPEPDNLLELARAQYPEITNLQNVMKRIKKRLKNGWPVDIAISTPPLSRYQHTAEISANAMSCEDHLGNVYPSVKARAKAYGLNSTTVEDRLKHGWTLQDALTVAPNDKSVQYKGQTDHKGKYFKSIADMAEYWHIPRKTLEYRLNHGWDMKDALTMPVSRLNRYDYKDTD